MLSTSLGLTACQPVTPTPTPVPTPLPNTVTVTGRMFDIASGRYINSLAVRLAVINVEMDMWIDDQRGPTGFTDEQGYFTISNIPPGSYVMVAGYQESAFGVVEESPDKPRVFIFEADKITDVGELSVVLH